MSKMSFTTIFAETIKIHLSATVNMNAAPVVGCRCFLPLFCHFFPRQILGPSAESDESDDYVAGHDDVNVV